jgi:hypothetical protein
MRKSNLFVLLDSGDRYHLFERDVVNTSKI